MRSFWSDPYLWIHLAGLSAFPLFLEGCLIGFAMGEPFLPVWLELLLVAIVGITPILWMQWQRPFYIFSIVAVSVKPEALTEDQRRFLTLFKLPRNRVLAALVPVALVVVLRKAYEIAPIASASVSFLPAWHGLGLLLVAIAFLACNLFVQVPVSVASVMLSSESAFTATRPYPLEQVRRSFTIFGLQLKQILPPVLLETQTALATVPQSTAAEAAIQPSQKTDSATVDGANSFDDDVWAERTAPADPSALNTPAETDATGEAEAHRTESEASNEADLT
ncbi:low-complexity tail membrane protein [Stenomitos frigidus]|uniref:Low-complexity tail membrane protein n=1 Tax=Stenomitos frigidus ULC18 TaxID=2107698 RepID=A0A2T1ELR3_9CYAN|nr:low-complexity tail membrane protein [Stenomitos frigidus]PSB33645.1 low-complexity tail membrane protein [Stenomitos frigidus ULC18]